MPSTRPLDHKHKGYVTISEERFDRLVQDRHDLRVTLVAALCALEELHREAHDPNGTVQLAGRYMPIIRIGRKHLDRMNALEDRSDA